MDLTEIQNLIKFVSKAGVTEVEIEQKDFKITIKADPAVKKTRGQAAQPEIPVVHQVQVPVQGVPAMPPAAPVAAAPAPEPAPAAPAAAAPAADDNSKYLEVKSPMIGTFYRAPSPDKPPFIEVGETIKAGDTVCVVEAMKLFNEIESEVTGKIVKVLVDDSSPVEYDQPLFLVDPS